MKNSSEKSFEYFAATVSARNDQPIESSAAPTTIQARAAGGDEAGRSEADEHREREQRVEEPRRRPSALSS